MGEEGVHENGVGEDATARSRVETNWPLRPWLFAGLLALAGFAIHLLIDDAGDSGPRMAAAAFLAFASGAFVFTAERGRLLAPAIFSLVTGLVVGGLTWRAVGAGNDVADGGYALAAGFFACLLAVPLFQADFHRRWLRTDYKDIHYFVWTDAITGAGAFIFFLIAWLLIWLVAALLDLVGIPLGDLVETGWFTATYAGLALGAGLGTLRNQLKIIGTLQSVVLLVLSILALPLAIAIAVFLGAVVVSGPSVLWDATDSATPVLLSIAIGAFVLANAVLRDRDADMVGGPVLKWSGYALALGILPLTLFAAISTGVRIDQHGLSPERLWALASVGVAVAFGLAYFLDALLGARASWRDRLRASNLRLAVATAISALFLALPILNFGALSTKDQVARLESGAISVEEFDFSALRWDFGEPGRKALARLAKSDNAAVAREAKQAQAQESRPYRPYRDPADDGKTGERRLANLAIKGGDEGLQMAIRSYVEDSGVMCFQSCRALVVGPRPEGTHVILTDGRTVQHLAFENDGVARELGRNNGRLGHGASLQAPAEAFGECPDGECELEIRPYEGRQLYVDGEPVGEPFQ